MPRITGQRRLRLDVGRQASMRPGRNAPDNLGVARDRTDAALASMRPGRNAPDNGDRRVLRPRGELLQ